MWKYVSFEEFQEEVNNSVRVWCDWKINHLVVMSSHVRTKRAKQPLLRKIKYFKKLRARN